MRRAIESDKQNVIEILSKSFGDNKSVNYVVKSDKKRVERIRGLMAYSFDMCHAFGEVWVSDDDQACALILFPEKKKTSLRTVWWDIKLALSVIGVGRVFSVLKRESMIKGNHPKDHFAYLWFIGVNPQNQSKGLGSAIIQEVIDECEKKNRPIYLETSTERNLPFYRKFKFEIFESLKLSYTLYQLRRI